MNIPGRARWNVFYGCIVCRMTPCIRSDLSQIYVQNPFDDDNYIAVPFLEPDYTQNLLLWNHRAGGVCNAALAADTSVTLTGVLGAGSTFAGWSGACSGTGACNVTLDASKQVTAAFNTIENNYEVFLPIIIRQ